MDYSQHKHTKIKFSPTPLPVLNSRSFGETGKVHNYRPHFPNCYFIFVAIHILRFYVSVDKCNSGAFAIKRLTISPLLLVLIICLLVTDNTSPTVERIFIIFFLLKFVDALQILLKSGKIHGALLHGMSYSLNIYRSQQCFE